jgi:hypothetical protein
MEFISETDRLKKTCYKMLHRELSGRKWRGGWRRQHNEELHNFYASPKIIWETKSNSIRCAGHATCMGSREMYTES